MSAVVQCVIKRAAGRLMIQDCFPLWSKSDDLSSCFVSLCEVLHWSCWARVKSQHFERTFCLLFLCKSDFLASNHNHLRFACVLCLYCILVFCCLQGRCINFTRVQSRWCSNKTFSTSHFIPVFGQRWLTCKINISTYIFVLLLYFKSVVFFLCISKNQAKEHIIQLFCLFERKKYNSLFTKDLQYKYPDR